MGGAVAPMGWPMGWPIMAEGLGGAAMAIIAGAAMAACLGLAATTIIWAAGAV